MWRFKRRKQIRRGYPVSFKQMFIGLPENITKIDAVYERPIDNCIIFFTGNFMLSVIRVLLTKFKQKKFSRKNILDIQWTTFLLSSQINLRFGFTSLCGGFRWCFHLGQKWKDLFILSKSILEVSFIFKKVFIN